MKLLKQISSFLFKKENNNLSVLIENHNKEMLRRKEFLAKCDERIDSSNIALDRNNRRINEIEMLRNK